MRLDDAVNVSANLEIDAMKILMGLLTTLFHKPKAKSSFYDFSESRKYSLDTFSKVESISAAGSTVIPW